MLYWQWLVFGLLLMLCEIFVPSFTLLWFGAGAVIVGGLLWMSPELTMAFQFTAWAVISVILALLWFRFLKPMAVDRTRAGLSKEQIVGESAMVLLVPQGDQRGRVRFTKPVLGSDEWPMICEQAVQAGDRVFVVDVLGNAVVVKPSENNGAGSAR